MRIDQTPNKAVLAVITEKLKDASIRGAVIPFSEEEFELAGGFEDEAYDFDDARTSSLYTLEEEP